MTKRLGSSVLRVATTSLASIVLAAFAMAPCAAGDLDAKFAKLERVDAIVEGPANDAKFVLYVLFDANCLYCHLTWKAVQPYEKVGLQVRWIPVAYQQASSVGRAAAIMLAPDRVAAMRINEIRYDPKRFEGGIAPAPKVPPALAASFEANTSLMNALGAPGTPVAAWRHHDGRVQVRIGMIRLSELPKITGLPAQRNDDPDLANFR
ncbi:MAG TPA: disulfide isomerase [Casimicrobiaceae bacterium]|nr:disulfide isomerase [Casimicrobiaceae bacterium]